MMVNTHLRVLQRFDEEIEQGMPWPRPHCRNCGEGYVSWEKPESTRNEQSMKDMNHPGWEPEWITGTMHVIGHCDDLAGDPSTCSSFRRKSTFPANPGRVLSVLALHNEV